MDLFILFLLVMMNVCLFLYAFYPEEDEGYKGGPKALIILRGLPNSGKTTVANMFGTQAVYAADDYFEKIASREGISYADAHDPDLLYAAHMTCRNNVTRSMLAGAHTIVVHNIFVKRSDLKPYYKLATKHGYRVHALHVERNHNQTNDHEVAPFIIARMARQWQSLDERIRVAEQVDSFWEDK